MGMTHHSALNDLAALPNARLGKEKPFFGWNFTGSGSFEDDMCVYQLFDSEVMDLISGLHYLYLAS